jgi:membrane-bound lytic murein transglycosylase B
VLFANEIDDFNTWLSNFEQKAIEVGISRQTIEKSFKNIVLNERVIELDQKQPEFTISLEKYLSNTTPRFRVNKGKKLYQENKDLLEEISNKFGVQPRFLLALWGIETSFGKYTGSFNVIRSLTTLSYDLRRRDYFTW